MPSQSAFSRVIRSGAAPRVAIQTSGGWSAVSAMNTIPRPGPSPANAVAGKTGRASLPPSGETRYSRLEKPD